METSSATLVLRGTVIRYEVNKQMNVKAYQCPLDVVRENSNWVHHAQPANGTSLISGCISCVYTLFGRNLRHNLPVFYVLVNVSSHFLSTKNIF